MSIDGKSNPKEAPIGIFRYIETLIPAFYQCKQMSIPEYVALGSPSRMTIDSGTNSQVIRYSLLDTQNNIL
jgi:hypothetical protein